MALPHLPLDNTNVLTIKNIYFSNSISFFFFFCLGKLNAHQEFSRKSSCMTVIEASVPVQSFHLRLSSAIKLLSHCLVCLFFLSTKQHQLIQTETEYRMRTSWRLLLSADCNMGWKTRWSSDILRAFNFQLLKNLDIY